MREGSEGDRLGERARDKHTDMTHTHMHTEEQKAKCLGAANSLTTNWPGDPPGFAPVRKPN